MYCKAAARELQKGRGYWDYAKENNCSIIISGYADICSDRLPEFRKTGRGEQTDQ